MFRSNEKIWLGEGRVQEGKWQEIRPESLVGLDSERYSI